MTLTGHIVGTKGNTGRGIASIVENADYTITINLTDGTSYTTAPIAGFTDVAFDENYDLVVTKTDETTETVPTDIEAFREVLEGYKDDAETSATNASGYADDASDSATSATEQATLARSYAKGDTSSRTGEATDNADYYRGLSASSASASASSASISETQALKSEGHAVGKQNGTDVTSDSDYYHNNAKYYAEEASTSATNASASESTATAAAGVLTNCSATATTLSAGSNATASYSNGVFSFGVPKGADGSLASGVLAPNYSTYQPYLVGDYVYYNGNLYRCNTDIPKKEAWTSSHWDSVALAKDVFRGKSDFSMAVNGGVQTFESLGEFVVGGLNPDGTVLESQTFRVSSATHITLDRDVTVYVKSGYRCGYIPFSEGSAGSWSGWFTSTFTLSKGTEFVLQITTATPEMQDIIANVNTFVNAITIGTRLSDIVQDTVLVDKRQMTSGALQSEPFVVSEAVSWLTYLHMIPVTPYSVVRVVLPELNGVSWRYRFAWYNSSKTLIDQEARTATNYLTIPSNAAYFAFAFVAYDADSGTELTTYNLLENFPEDDVALVELGVQSDGLASNNAIVDWAYATFTKKHGQGAESGAVYSSDGMKRTLYTQQVGKQLLYNQGFCMYDNKYYSIEAGHLGVQDASFSTVADVSVSVGHGNNLQLGNSNIAYVNGIDHNVYKINLDTNAVVGAISLPYSTGMESAVIDDINNIAYIMHTEDPTSQTDPQYFTLACYDLTTNTIISEKPLPFGIVLFQGMDFYEGRIYWIAGNNTNTNNRLYIISLDGTAISSMKLTNFSGDEPEGVFYGRADGELYVSGYQRKIYRLSTN